MKLPRKGILIRLAIYLPIIGFLSWRAFFVGDDEPVEAEKPAQRVRTISGPDGKEFKVIEVSPEEAKAMGIELPANADAQPEQPAADPPKR